jgi:peptidylprolyl isomerase
MPVKKGDRVKIHYTGKLKDGTVFESSIGGEPLQFTVGKGKVIKGFETAVLGMETHQVKTVTIKPSQGYGPSDPALVLTVNRDELPGGLTPAVGQILSIAQEDGSKREMNVAKIEGDLVTLDGNHPLAGKELTFEIRLVGIG